MYKNENGKSNVLINLENYKRPTNMIFSNKQTLNYKLMTFTFTATAGGMFRVRGYHQPSSQHFGVDMNINNVVIFINFLFTKL